MTEVAHILWAEMAAAGVGSRAVEPMSQLTKIRSTPLTRGILGGAAREPPYLSPEDRDNEDAN